MMCGRCNLCFGYFEPKPAAIDTGAENQLCPAGAIIRQSLGDPLYEFTINERLCIGCGKCVRGLHGLRQRVAATASASRPLPELQPMFHRPGMPFPAFVRVPAHAPYLLKYKGQQA